MTRRIIGFTTRIRRLSYLQLATHSKNNDLTKKKEKKKRKEWFELATGFEGASLK